ncbi:MAG: amidohydrolase [Clostridia bacterium]|nr:amidohydrolase [Clostridia bacterium]
MNSPMLQKLVELRREFHKCAESGWLEFETTIKIITYLDKLGLEVRYGKTIHGKRQGLPSQEKMDAHKKLKEHLKCDFDVEEIFQGYTGAIGILDTKTPGPTIALRFDIDANDIMEAQENHRPAKEGFSSEHKNMMHACGHDGHIAIGLATAQYIVSRKNDLKGKVIFIFQPAEEGVRGAKSIVQSGILDHVNYILSGHIGFMGKENEIICGVGGFLATSKLDVYFKGQSAHAGAYPEKGRNALLAAANCTINLHTLTQYSGGMSRMNVGTFHAGTARNAVPAEAKIELELRGETQDINEDLRSRVEGMIEASAKMYGVSCEIVEMGSAPAYKYEKNDFSTYVVKLLEAQGFSVSEGASMGASEDVTYLFQEVEKNGGKALYLIFGTALSAPHHHPSFDFSEEVLEASVRSYSKILLNLLMKQKAAVSK